VLVLAAVVLAAAGVLVWWRSRRRGTPEGGLLSLIVGLAGLYVSLWGAVTREHWLYLPGGALVVASYGLDFARRRRSWRRDRAAGSGESLARGD
jgi:hypothetical protein